MTYRDMTFCDFCDCKKYKKCHRAMTPSIEEAIHLSNSDVSLFMEKPPCYEEKKSVKIYRKKGR